MKTWLLKRFREPSTWAGLVTVATAVFGFSVSEEQQQAIVAVGTAIVGLLFVFIKEPEPPKESTFVKMPDGMQRELPKLPGREPPGAE